MTLLSNLRRLLSLKTFDVCPLFALSDVLLDNKEKFKHGGVDTMIYACIFLMIWTQFWDYFALFCDLVKKFAKEA